MFPESDGDFSSSSDNDYQPSEHNTEDDDEEDDKVSDVWKSPATKPQKSSALSQQSSLERGCSCCKQMVDEKEKQINEQKVVISYLERFLGIRGRSMWKNVKQADLKLFDYDEHAEVSILLQRSIIL